MSRARLAAALARELTLRDFDRLRCLDADFLVRLEDFINFAARCISSSTMLAKSMLDVRFFLPGDLELRFFVGMVLWYVTVLISRNIF